MASTIATRTIDRDRLHELMDQGAQLVEVLPEAEYEREHLPGAVNLPLKQLSPERARQLLDPDRVIVTYCNGFL